MLKLIHALQTTCFWSQLVHGHPLRVIFLALATVHMTGLRQAQAEDNNKSGARPERIVVVAMVTVVMGIGD